MITTDPGRTTVDPERTPPSVATGSDPWRTGRVSEGPCPPFVAPGLVLLAAASLLEGYLWLHVIPVGPLRPSGLLFAAVVAPATYGLTRVVPVGTPSWLRRTTLVCAAAVPLAGVLVVVHTVGGERAFGVVSLALAAAILALAVLSEHSARRDSRPG